MKNKTSPTTPLLSSLVFSALLVASVALVLRWVDTTRPALASAQFFDVRFASRTLQGGAVGTLSLHQPVSGVEGITAAKPEVELLEQQPKILWLAPGRSATLTLKIKNLSGKSWLATGAKAVTVQLETGSSGALRHKWWKQSTVIRLRSTVKARGTTVLRIPVTGPPAAGYAEDTFVLYQGSRRIPGGTFTVGALVGESDQPHLSAQIETPEPLTLKAGAEASVTLKATNTGRLPWKNRGFNRVRLLPQTDGTVLQNASWPTASIAALLPVAMLPSGMAADIPLTIKAPAQPGTSTAHFALAASGIGPINGSGVALTVTVPEETPSVSKDEPLVRIGLFSQTVTPTAVIKATGPAKLTKIDGTVILDSVTEVTLAKEGTQYRYTAGESTGLSDLALRVDAPASTILEIVNWENRPSWDTSLNDNTVRGTVEFRTGLTGKTWAINELPVDTYLLGLAETSAASPLEFRKALITAARTYALHHAAKKTKHADDFYDINGTTDQVYRGYAHEQRAPSVRAAVEGSRGMVVFHPAARTEINPLGFALTAYFACTDGRTRSFEEVFGGDGSLTPYLISVEDPKGICTNQRYLQGLDGNHMVGLSGKGGIVMAQDGKTFTEILSYYYTGVTISQYYE